MVAVTSEMARVTSTMSNFLRYAIVTGIIAFGVFVWPTPFRYEHWHGGNLVRINRFTQSVDVLRDAWIRLDGTGWRSKVY
jgi:hypothetical protein